MDFDIESHLGAVEVSVLTLERDGRPARAVTILAAARRRLWNAVTNRERIPRWFLPIGGDLELGGRCQLEGNAGGAITACERPSHFALTWEFGGNVSWVEACLSDDGAPRARLALTHTALFSGNTGTSTGPARSGSAGRWASWDSPSISPNRLCRSRTKPPSPFHATARRSFTGSSAGCEQGALLPEPTSRVPQPGRTTEFYAGESTEPA